MTEEASVTARRDRALGHITLDRSAAANALTRPMKRTISDAIIRWGTDANIYAIVVDSAVPRAFCSGADLGEFVDPGARLEDILTVQAKESRLIWQLECCVKPIASLIDGVVMGSGAGLAMFGTHRVAGEDFRFAMPEASLGYFPDAGASAFLGRMPDSIGIYLGLTGARVGRSDAYDLGLVTHCIGREHFDTIRQALADADPIDPLLDDRQETQPPGELQRLRPAIARCFGKSTVEEIMAALASERGETETWAKATLARLGKCAPASLKITLQQLRRTAGHDLDDLLKTEYRMAVHCLPRQDFQEGIRCFLAGGEASPVWSPATLPDVTTSLVDEIFAPVGPRELVLPPRPPSLVAVKA